MLTISICRLPQGGEDSSNSAGGGREEQQGRGEKSASVPAVWRIAEVGSEAAASR